MVKLARWLTVVVAVLLALVVAVVLGAQLKAELAEVKVEPAASNPELFEEVFSAIRHGNLGDSQFRDPVSENVDRYAFVTYTVNLSSFCLLPAEWAVLELSPLPEDLAFLSGDGETVSPLSGRTLTATLLTTREAAEEARELSARYYVFGRAMSSMVEQAT